MKSEVIFASFSNLYFLYFATMNSLKTLNPYFWKHRVLLFWGLLFIIASNFFAIYQVQFVGQKRRCYQKCFR